MKKVKTKVKAKVKAKAQSKIKNKNIKKVIVKKMKTIKAKTPIKTTSKTSKKITAVKKHTSAALGPVGVKPYQLKTSEEYMNEKQLKHFQNILLEWREQLMSEVDRTMHHMQDEAANYPDPVDRASQEEEFSLELRTRDRERKLLKKIDEALNRIKDHDYGFCDDCGAEIGVRRLEARPTATQCIECKTIAEIREKQTGEVS